MDSSSVASVAFALLASCAYIVISATVAWDDELHTKYPSVLSIVAVFVLRQKAKILMRELIEKYVV